MNAHTGADEVLVFHMKRQTHIIQILPVFIYFIDRNNINWIALLTSPIVWANMLLVVFDNCKKKKTNFAGDRENLCDRRRIHNSRSDEPPLNFQRNDAKSLSSSQHALTELPFYLKITYFLLDFLCRKRRDLRCVCGTISMSWMAIRFHSVLYYIFFVIIILWSWYVLMLTMMLRIRLCVEQHSTDTKTKSKTIWKYQNWYTQVTLEFYDLACSFFQSSFLFMYWITWSGPLKHVDVGFGFANDRFDTQKPIENKS